MKIKLILISLLLMLVIFLSGCVQQPKQEVITCNGPYILVGTSCCLDKDYNNICDKDEIKEIQQDEPQQVEVITQSVTEKSYCGDETCDSDESCSSCPLDCGICQKEFDLQFDSSGSGTCSGSEDNYECNVATNAVVNYALYYSNKGKNTLNNIKAQTTCERVINGYTAYYFPKLDQEIEDYFFQNKGAVFEPLENFPNMGEYVIKLAAEGYVQYVVNLDLDQVFNKEYCDIAVGDRATVKCVVKMYSSDGPVVENTVNLEIYVDDYVPIRGCDER